MNLIFESLKKLKKYVFSFWELEKIKEHGIYVFVRLKKLQKHKLIFCKLENDQNMLLIFYKQAAGGPTGWGQRGPVGPRGLL